MSKSFLGKAIFVIGLIIAATVVIFFAVNKKDIEASTEEVEIITSLNVDTYDYDIYIYNINNNILSGSKFFYNKVYLDTHEVEYEEYKINDKTKLFLKNLSNTEKDINNIKITYDPITLDEFKYLYENYTMLKVYVWIDDNNNIEKALLYSNTNTYLDVQKGVMD